jgi:6-phosphogluconate dehydrogenase
MKIGIIGLGKMGSRIAQKLYEDGHEVVAWNRSKFKIQNSEFKIAESIDNLISRLEAPRVVWLMLPQGDATQDILDQLQRLLQKGDIVIDGGNAHFQDTEKRYQHFKKLGIEFLGIGVSGGVVAFKNGYPLMVGGSKKAYEFIKPILFSLVKPNGGYQYFGEGGAGHFVKMVHNGIEYGVMQSLGEGFEVLEKSQYKFNLLEVAKLWQKGSLVSGFMLDRAVDALVQSPGLQDMAGPIAESGEARWTIEEAKKENVQAEIIEKSLKYRVRSQENKKIQNSFTAKMINGLRSAFGGHSIRQVFDSKVAQTQGAQDESGIKK